MSFLHREYLDGHGEELREGEGACRAFGECPPGQVFWPPTGECHQHHTRGPCLNGYLIYVNPNTGEWEQRKRGGERVKG